MKKNDWFIIFIIFILTVPSHFINNCFNNVFTDTLFPVNESIWEHMKLLVTPTLFITFLNYLKNKKNGIAINNYPTAVIISIIISIFFYLIIYIPIDLVFGHNLVVSIILLFITIVLQVLIIKYLSLKKERNINIQGFVLLILFILFLGILTYHPLKNYLFLDKVTNSYGK